MSIEIEGKMRLQDPGAVETTLKAINAEFSGEIIETNTFFDTRQGELKSGDQGLRIRVEKLAEEKRQVTITHKGPRAHGKLKSRNETELRVQSAHDAAQLLAELGYQPVLTFEKRRRRFVLDGCHVELDHLPYIGDFIEIEGPSDESVLSVREKLGLAGEPLVKTSYIAMLASYLREHHLSTTIIRLEDAEQSAT